MASILPSESPLPTEMIMSRCVSGRVFQVLVFRTHSDVDEEMPYLLVVQQLSFAQAPRMQRLAYVPVAIKVHMESLQVWLRSFFASPKQIFLPCWNSGFIIRQQQLGGGSARISAHLEAPLPLLEKIHLRTLF